MFKQGYNINAKSTFIANNVWSYSDHTLHWAAVIEYDTYGQWSVFAYVVNQSKVALSSKNQPYDS